MGERLRFWRPLQFESGQPFQVVKTGTCLITGTLPNHQGKDNVLLFPSSSLTGGADGPMQCRERLGGLLKYYERKAA